MAGPSAAISGGSVVTVTAASATAAAATVRRRYIYGVVSQYPTLMPSLRFITLGMLVTVRMISFCLMDDIHVVGI